MLEAAAALLFFLGGISWIGRIVRKREAMKRAARRNARERLHRTIAHCEKVAKSCAFPLPNTMRIVILKRIAMCWWAMHSLGERHAMARAERCECTIQELHNSAAASATYPLPVDGPDKERILQSLLMLNRFLINEIKTAPPYMQRIIAEKQEIEDTFLSAKLMEYVTKGERALAFNSLGSARAAFESADKLLKESSGHSRRLIELATRCETGLQEVRKRLERERMFEDVSPVSTDGLERMFAKGKERWS